MAEIYYLIIVIILFSTIQSIFGVGLLLFGTPTLLLSGYSYSETLWLLLPCSVVISLIQVVGEYELIQAKKKAVYLIIPALVLSLTLVLAYDSTLNITKIVGSMLLMIGSVKFSSKLQIFLRSIIKNHLQVYYIMIGAVHGVSNMGGGPLSIFMSNVYSTKERIRANIAFIYLILAMFQIFILYIISKNDFQNRAFILILVSSVTYLFVNKFISKKINNKRYLVLLNTIVLIYGLLAVIK